MPYLSCPTWRRRRNLLAIVGLLRTWVVSLAWYWQRCSCFKIDEYARSVPLHLMYHRLLLILEYGNLYAESGDLGGQQILA
ncbi:hypothetical protein F4804DRAFT_246203 [Jackrogersella minutella]|nr:hypothetical protein F4804DRAFT_246203 [Jackrogersella minutella]